jgi:hypothetical protein
MVAFLISNGTFQWPRAHIRALYMMVALLDSVILRNLHLGRTTLYDLCDEDDEALPVIIADLAKHATNNENGGFFLFRRTKRLDLHRNSPPAFFA